MPLSSSLWRRGECKRHRCVVHRDFFPGFILLSAFLFLDCSQKPIRPEHRAEGLGRISGQEIGDDLAGGWGEAQAEHDVEIRQVFNGPSIPERTGGAQRARRGLWADPAPLRRGSGEKAPK